jgi:Lower baseplate protein N-terminal domain
MANTIIQFKRSEATAAPTSLSFAEPAYSFNANKLYIGNTTGHVHTIGGRFYTELLDAATDSNTFSAIVKRDSAGIFSATAVKASLYGNANTATKIANDFWINLSGDIEAAKASGNGSANIDLTIELSDTGVAATTYGGGTTIPVFTVDIDGRLTFAGNVAAAASGSFNVDGDSGSGILSSGETIEFIGGDGITTSISDVTPGVNVTIEVDSTVVRTTGDQTIGGTKTFNGPDLIISGNLTVSGTTTYANTTHLDIGDNILTLNADLPGGSSPSENAGIAVNRGSATDVEFRWNETSDFWELTEDGTNYKRIFHDSYANATSFTTGTLAVARGGTNISSYAVGDLIYADGTSSLAKLADVAVGSALISGGVGVAPSWGKIGLTTHITGTLNVSSGGTNISSYTIGDIIYADGTASLAKLPDVATGSVLISGGIGAAPSYGKVGLTTHISGTLAVGNGGTGNTEFTTNGILYGRGTGAVMVTAAGTEGKVLQANDTGVPVFGDVDGGTF